MERLPRQIGKCFAEPAPQILQGALPLVPADARMARHPRADPRGTERDKRLSLQLKTRWVRRDPPLRTHRPAFECGAPRGGQHLSGGARSRGDGFSRLGAFPLQQAEAGGRRRAAGLVGRGRDRRDLAPVRPHRRPHPARMARRARQPPVSRFVRPALLQPALRPGAGAGKADPLRPRSAQSPHPL